jgi:orotate phosphoribosyltransferase
MEEHSWLKAVAQAAGPFPVALAAIYAAVQLGETDRLLAGGSLGLGLAAFAFGALLLHRWERNKARAEEMAESPTARSSDSVSDDEAVLTQQLAEVASPELRTKAPPPNVSALDWVIYLHLKSNADAGLGTNGHIPARYFVDLREAALLQDHLEIIVQEMVGHVRRYAYVANYSGVIIPKSGNPQFSVAVAHALGLEPIVVREHKIYETYLETNLQKGRVFLLDDVWADADVLVATADKARRAGYNLAEAFLLIERREGQARQQLAALNPPIRLKSLLTWGDQDLEGVKERAERATLDLLRGSGLSGGSVRALPNNVHSVELVRSLDARTHDFHMGDGPVTDSSQGSERDEVG